MEHSTGEDVTRLDAREQAHVLDEDGINTDAIELSNKTQRILHLIVIDEGVDSDVDGGAKLVGVGTELDNVVKTIASSLSCTKTGCANIQARSLAGARSSIVCMCERIFYSYIKAAVQQTFAFLLAKL